MNSTQLKLARRRMIAEHAQRLKKLDVEIAEAGIRERHQIEAPITVCGLVAKFRQNGKPMASWSEIASELNRRGLKAPHDRRWSKVSIERWYNQEVAHSGAAYNTNFP